MSVLKGPRSASEVVGALAYSAMQTLIERARVHAKGRCRSGPQACTRFIPLIETDQGLVQGLGAWGIGLFSTLQNIFQGLYRVL